MRSWQYSLGTAELDYSCGSDQKVISFHCGVLLSDY